MLLTIDAGNTNTVFAIHDGAAFLGEWRCQTAHARTADEYYVWLRELMRLNGVDVKIERVAISSVVPQVAFNLRLLSDRYFGVRPLVVGKEGCALPIEKRVDEGTHVGADRLVNTVGAYTRYGGNLIIVDFGTATTFDVVDHDGAYLGGAIAPGVNLSIAALHEAAAALPHIDVRETKKVIGKNTVDCMQAGVFWGYIGMVEGIVGKIRLERAGEVKVIGTGGLASLFDRGTSIFDGLDFNLTLHGLVVIDAFNHPQTSGNDQ